MWRTQSQEVAVTNINISGANLVVDGAFTRRVH